MMTDKRLEEIKLLYLRYQVSSKAAPPEHHAALETIPELIEEIKRQALVIEKLLFPEKM